VNYTITDSGRPFDTPTSARLRVERKQQHDRLYVFRLDEHQLTALRDHELPDSALLAYAVIAAAAWGGREWVVVPAKTMELMRRDYRWWHRATAQLEAAGLLESRRHRGRLPRYQLSKLCGPACVTRT
jgi:hypothetical protein